MLCHIDSLLQHRDTKLQVINQIFYKQVVINKNDERDWISPFRRFVLLGLFVETLKA